MQAEVQEAHQSKGEDRWDHMPLGLHATGITCHWDRIGRTTAQSACKNYCRHSFSSKTASALLWHPKPVPWLAGDAHTSTLEATFYDCTVSLHASAVCTTKMCLSSSQPRLQEG
eukprot:1160291-Pelagomonas_calceolata.AAC.10